MKSGLSREPALLINTLGGVLGLVATFGLPGLTPHQSSLIVAALSAVAAAITAIKVRPIAPAVFTGAVAAVVALAGAYGMHFSQNTVGAVNVMTIAVLTLLTRGQVTPVVTLAAQQAAAAGTTPQPATSR